MMNNTEVLNIQYSSLRFGSATPHEYYQSLLPVTTSCWSIFGNIFVNFRLHKVFFNLKVQKIQFMVKHYLALHGLCGLVVVSISNQPETQVDFESKCIWRKKNKGSSNTFQDQ